MSKIWRLLFALALLGAAYGLRAPWLGRAIWNLDEGSTFTMGEQVLHGGVIYRDAADNRSPLVPYLKAAVFAVCGEWNAHAVHVAVALMLGACAVLLWLAARRLGDEKAGVAGAVFFTLLTFLMLDVPDTLSAHTGWFVVFFSVIGYWLFAGVQARPAFWPGAAVGACFGLAALCKQPGMLDLGVTLVLIGLLAWTVPDRRRAWFRLGAGELAGFAAVLAVMIAYFAANHAVDDLRFYAWTYNTKYYVPEVPIWERIWAARVPFRLLWENMPAALAAGVAAAVILLPQSWRGLRQRPPVAPLLPWLILGSTGAGLVSTVISGREFSHYCAQVIPGLSLACGWTVARLLERMAALRAPRPRAAAALAGLLVLACGVTGFNWTQRIRMFSPRDDATKAMGELARAFAAPTDRIFVWGYLPEMYFFSQRLPSTRFIYTNYLTGMIPWTNLDMLVDTRYAVVPGSWQRLREDLDRHPPALIVDTLDTRGYLKYPLYRQDDLWTMVTRDFAQVDYGATQNSGLKFYRRLAPLPTGGPPESGPVDGGIAVTATLTVRGGRLPLLEVKAPAGTTEIVVYQGDRPYRHLVYPADQPCDAAFFVDRRDLAGSATAFRVAVRRADGWRSSRPVDLAFCRQPPPPPSLTSPPIKLGDRVLLPIEADTYEGGPGFPEDNYGLRWAAHAPSRIVYECPPDLKKLTFSYGVEREAYEGRPHGDGTTGVDVVVSFERPDGGITQLFWRRLDPRSVGPDQGRQTSQVDIPPHTQGRLILQFLPGPHNDPSFDWTYWANLGGQGVGPDLRYGERYIPAVIGQMFDGRPMEPLQYGRWSAQSPAKVVYPYVQGMSSLTFTYGMEERTYDPPPGLDTDGVEVVAEFEHPDLRVERLFSRLLDPRNNPGDRGPQTTRVRLPLENSGRIILRIGPGPKSNTAYDWAYLANLRAQGPGPDIVWGSRILVPVESETFNGLGMREIEGGAWGAHAPSRLIYDRPADLEAVSFSYGLEPGSYANPDPGRRTDGVDVTVEFQARDGRSTTLFHRRLTPATNPIDRGRQSARVELPPGQPGRLRFLIGPGPRNSNAFDWAYWADFIGAP